jgi:hypothetical protein
MMSIIEVGTVHERLNLLIDHFCRGNKTAFGRETDILPGVLASITGGRLSKPSFELLQKVMTRYPEVSGDWLILGRGSMLHGRVAEAAVSTPEALPSKELEEMVRQLVKNQLSERARRVGYERDKAKKALSEKLDNLKADVEFNKEFTQPSVTFQGARFTINESGEDEEVKITREMLLEQIQQYEEEAESIREELNEYSRVDERVRQEMRTTVYRLIGSEPRLDKPYFGMLHIRLSIPDKVAEQLVISGKIRSVKIEGEGYLITEQAVREFLGEA